MISDRSELVQIKQIGKTSLDNMIPSNDEYLFHFQLTTEEANFVNFYYLDFNHGLRYNMCLEDNK